jgi:hypothetical protein
LIGGVVTGQSLIESAKIRSAIKEIEQMQTAIRAYQLEFDALPGDHKDAYDYFSDECGGDNTNDRFGCNGYGDRCVGGISNICPPANFKYFGDMRRVFVHLNKSGIMPDVAHEVDTDLENTCKAGDAFPISDSGDGNTYTIFNAGSAKKLKMWFWNDQNFKEQDPSDMCRISGVPLPFTPKQAKNIDEKLDDGNGVRGKVIAADLDGCRNDDTGEYVLVNSNEYFCRIQVDLE